MTTLEVIERETGQTVTEDTLLEDLAIDSLEFLELLVALDIPNDNSSTFKTIGDLVKAAA